MDAFRVYLLILDPRMVALRLNALGTFGWPILNVPILFNPKGHVQDE